MTFNHPRPPSPTTMPMVRNSSGARDRDPLGHGRGQHGHTQTTARPAGPGRSAVRLQRRAGDLDRPGSGRGQQVGQHAVVTRPPPGPPPRSAARRPGRRGIAPRPPQHRVDDDSASIPSAAATARRHPAPSTGPGVLGPSMPRPQRSHHGHRVRHRVHECRAAHTTSWPAAVPASARRDGGGVPADAVTVRPPEPAPGRVHRRRVMSAAARAGARPLAGRPVGAP